MQSRPWLRAAALAASALLWPVPATPFFPTTPLPVPDVVAMSHRRITEEALEAVELEIFGIAPTRSMRVAIAEIAAANAAVDRDRMGSAWHFDGEDFAGGQALLTAFQRPQVKAALQRGEAGTARRHLGQALHLLQDFYAHSNWVELGGGVNPDLGVPGTTIGGAAAPSEPTCGDCTPATPPECADCADNVSSTALTSGYFSGQDRPKPLAAKCSHGGPADESVTGSGLGINKDSPDCHLSPHASLHAQAAAVAREATIEFVRDLAAELTPREWRLLLGGGPTLALAINVTGSCPPGCTAVLPYLALKAPARALVESRLGTDEEPAKYVLVPFDKPAAKPTLATTDPEPFLSALAALESYGSGPGCPRPSMGAMLQALSAAEEGGTIFLVDRFTARDPELAASVAARAAAKRVQVFPILFGNGCNEPTDPGHLRAAAESGGQLFGLSLVSGSNMPRLVPLIDALVRRDLVRLLAVSGRLTQGPISVPVPIDSTVRRATFSVSGLRGMPLWRPDGTRVFDGQPNVVYGTHDAGDFYAVADPQPGLWRVDLAGIDPFSLHVFGESALDVDFRFVEAGGRPGHEGVFPIPGMPASGRPNDAVAVVSGPFGSVTFELRARDGSFLQTLDLAPGPGPGSFSGALTLPEGPSLVYAVGVDQAGHVFQRLVHTPVEPQPVRIVPPPPSVLAPGTTPISVFEVRNLSALPGTYRFRVVDDVGSTQEGTPVDLGLGPGGSRQVTVRRVIDAAVPLGSTVPLTATVEGIDGTSGRNFAVVTHSIGLQVDTTPPTIASFTATPAELRPANRRLVSIALSVEATDDGVAAPPCAISSVSSDEPVGGEPDWSIGPASLQLLLRAERDARGDGRLYTIEVTCTDSAGNASQATAEVRVPRKGKR